jgi:hypothetical protein
MMKYTIYQMDIKSELKFSKLPDDINIISLEEFNYKNVYENSISVENSDIALEEIFEKFNINHPEDFKGHSLSVSDLVVLKDRAFYCQPIGWKEITIIE